MTDRPIALLILGMHRSGTSALTRVLNLLGCRLAGELLGGNPSNPTGHWESLRALEINEMLLQSLGRRWDDVRAMPEGWITGPEAQSAKERIKAFIASEFGSIPLWVIKDPRLCLLAPLWLEALEELGIDARVIVPVRDPVEVADSLARRDGLAPVTGHLLWLRHLVAAEATSRTTPRVLSFYEDLLDNWRSLVDRIGTSIGIAWPCEPDQARAAIEDFLKPQLRHPVSEASQDAAANEAVPARVRELFAMLRDAPADDGWKAIADSANALPDGASWYEPVIGDLSRRLDQAERSVATIDATQRALNKALQARIGDMESTLREREATIDGQVQALAVRDAQVAELTEAYEGNKARMAALVRKLADLDGSMAAKDGRIEALNRTLSEVEHLCRLMTNSRSWKITRPLRTFSAALQNRSLRAATRGFDPAGIATADFDAQYYLMENADVRASGIDPYQHYVEHGKAEGRLPVRPAPIVLESAATFDPAKPTVLVVSHDASRTGAPVLSLNIAEGLRRRYNVISLPLRDGSLMEAIRRHSTLAIEPENFRVEPARVKGVIERLNASRPIKFAIVNSVESRIVLPVLAHCGVPTVCLIHEFAAYTRPRTAFPDAVWWATRTVFSTQLTRDGAVAEFAAFAEADFPIIPQGRCTLSTEPVDEGRRLAEEAWLLCRLRPDGLRDDSVLIIGVGSVQFRKGVDLFIQCAARVILADGGSRCRFAWIGQGYDPENDLAYSAYMADQIQRSGLADRIVLIGETPSIQMVYKLADILLVTSRLDPLPNVAIDAMAQGMPVLCFERTTGIADLLAEAELSDCISPYLDAVDMADKVVRLAASKELRRATGARLRSLVAERFSMDSYLERLESLADEAVTQMAAETEAARTIVASGLMQPDFFCPDRREKLPMQDIIRFEYVRPWAARIGQRKLFPGFHPGIYLERHGTPETWSDPLADYLRSGRPDGPWCHQVICPGLGVVRAQETPRVALHLHAYYLDLLPEILSRLQRNALRPDLFVSVADTEGAVEARRILKAYPGQLVDVIVVPNRGRDIGPLLTAFAPRLVDAYDIIGHIHTKKTADLKDPSVGERWFEFLLENLLGGKAPMADIILGQMASDPTIGLVFPDDPNIVGWDANLPIAQALAGRLGLGALPSQIQFPIGTMFWARSASIRPLLDLQLDWKEYPAEPLPYDGTILHALERLLGVVTEFTGARVALTHVPGVTR